jgi:outer membrane lipoprotein SlyB
MQKKFFALSGAVLAAAVLGLNGCATQSKSANVVSASQAQREQTVRLATVESVREVTIKRDNTGVGTLGGAALGGIAGSSIGGGRGQIAGAVAGAIAGGIAGQAIENSTNEKKGLEITVKLDNGEVRALVQEGDEQFRVGERVRLLTLDGVTRVTR